MWIQVRSMDGKNSVRIDGLSKLTKLEELREKLVEHFDASPERQRLFYRGKQVYSRPSNIGGVCLITMLFPIIVGKLFKNLCVICRYGVS